ncbi:MAG: SDR family NAD(P)-dependent oxidoreductase [Nitrospirae bacterium]|nr:SDR family NAD(P)-dependent oxidoreductase [Nitrospirota bacterium]
MPDSRPNRPVVLVTGASSGLGLATATLLAANGYRVYGTTRRGSAATARDRGAPTLLKLDVQDDASARRCVNEVLQTEGRLDILINNAGYFLGGALEETSIAEARDQFDTNFFGVVRMIQAVLPHMRSRRCGQILIVGSMAGLVSVPFAGFYAASKFALEGLAESLRHELRPLGIRVVLLEPGFFRSGMTEATRRTTRRISEYDSAREGALGYMARSQQNGVEPATLARAILKVLSNPRPRLRYRLGPDARLLPLLKSALPQSLFEWGTRRAMRLGND